MASAALLPGLARAGGLGLYEVGAPDLGTASAGRAALAADASTAWGNPAGMTRLQGSQILFGLQPLIVTTEFDVGTGTTTTGTNGGNAGGFVPSGGLYGVYEIMPDLKLGASLNSYVGGSLNYDDNWVGRFYTTQTELLTFNLNPVIAYRVLPWLSLAAGFSVQYADLKQELATPNALDPAADGRMKYQDHNFGFGGNIGALFEIDELTRVGLTYRSQVDQSFDDVPSFSRVPPGTVVRSLGLDMTIPQEVMLSGFRQVTDDLALMANFDWQNWSQFGQFNVGLSGTPPRSKAFDANLDDTFQAAFGVHYRLGAPTMLQLGFAYDSSAADEQQRTPSLPIDQQFRFAAGVTYAVTDDYTLGFAYEYASLGSASLDTTRGPLSGTLQGDYSTNTLNVLGFTVNHRF
ncbi:MAG: outer membrane protein transport protein [Deltaproteobacteria bacterium]|nr:outer membrane protein transport protein [Deltaproteobacteria bacterium]